MIVLFGTEKGGVGKTTVSTNIAAMLAIAGRDVLLIDTDHQGSAQDWATIREANEQLPQITTVNKFGQINQTVQKLLDKYDDIIIDAGGRESTELRSAILVADAWYIPTQASEFDVWSVMKMGTLMSEMRTFRPNLLPKLLVSRASTHPAADDHAVVKDCVKDMDCLSVSEAMLCERNAYRKAASRGMSVLELEKRDKDVKAINEIKKLYMEIVNDAASAHE